MFYAIFTDWKRKRRKFPLGSSLEDAEDALGELKIRNKGRYDFDAERKEREKARVKAITLSEWLDRYLGLVKGMASGEIKRSQCAHLKRLLGYLPLSEVTRVRIMEYKNRRLSEPLFRYEKPVEGTRVKGATVNREVSCLISALNLAADEDLCEGGPRIKKERETAREQTLTDVEYKALIDVSDRWLQRVIIAANEAALDRGSIVNLSWDAVQDGLLKIKGGRAKTGARQRVGISPALEEVLDELRAEYRKVPNTDRRIFTKDGKPIAPGTLRHAFDKAVLDAKLEDFVLKDFRHCARTRWAAEGLSFEIAEIGIGHKICGMAGRYTNLTDDHIRKAFQEMFTRCLQRNQSAADGYQRNNASA